MPAGLCSLAVVRKADRGSVSLYLPHGLAAVAKAADVNPGAAMLASGKAPDSESSEESDTESPTPSKVIGVAKLFSPGQYVACVVLRAMDTGEGATDKVLHVSLVPSVVNSGLGFEHLTKDLSTVWGAVVSKEDHGFVVDLGIPGVAAFLPFKSVVGGPSSLFPGSCAFFRVAVVKKSASSVSLSYDPSTSPHLMSQPGALSITSVKPGMLVKGSVKKVNTGSAV